MVATTTRVVLLILLCSASARAHPLAPTLLDVHDLGGGRLSVTWKASLLRVPGADLVPVLPEPCTNDGDPTFTTDADSVTRRWTVRCDPPELVGQQIGFRGLDAAKIDGL